MLLTLHEKPSWSCSFSCPKKTALKDIEIWAELVVGRLIQMIRATQQEDQMRANFGALITFHQRGERGERRRKRTRRSWKRRTLTQRGRRTWRTCTTPQAMDTSGPLAAGSSWTPGSRSLKRPSNIQESRREVMRSEIKPNLLIFSTFLYSHSDLYIPLMANFFPYTLQFPIVSLFLL